MSKLTMRFVDGRPQIELEYDVVPILSDGLSDDVYENFAQLSLENGLEIIEYDDHFIIRPKVNRGQDE